jgi:hypothetical protein
VVQEWGLVLVVSQVRRRVVLLRAVLRPPSHNWQSMLFINKMPLVKPGAFLFYNGLLLIIFYLFAQKMCI